MGINSRICNIEKICKSGNDNEQVPVSSPVFPELHQLFLCVGPFVMIRQTGFYIDVTIPRKHILFVVEPDEITECKNTAVQNRQFPVFAVVNLAGTWKNSSQHSGSAWIAFLFKGLDCSSGINSAFYDKRIRLSKHHL